jgi:hypothetical protein
MIGVMIISKRGFFCIIKEVAPRKTLKQFFSIKCHPVFTLKGYIEGPREYFKAGYPHREYLIYPFV